MHDQITDTTPRPQPRVVQYRAVGEATTTLWAGDEVNVILA